MFSGCPSVSASVHACVHVSVISFKAADGISPKGKGKGPVLDNSAAA